MSHNSETHIVGIYSPYAGAGKSTLATVLTVRYGFSRLKMAGPLKNMLREYLYGQGLDERGAEEMIEGSLKNVPSPLLAGKTPRHAMQTLGTEWGRDCMGTSFWVDAAKEQIEERNAHGLSVVIDDVRFPNEAQMIRDMGGVLVRVRRPSMEKVEKRPWWKFSRGHTSEGSLNDFTFDMEIENNYASPVEFGAAAATQIVLALDSGTAKRASVTPWVGR